MAFIKHTKHTKCADCDENDNVEDYDESDDANDGANDDSIGDDDDDNGNASIVATMIWRADDIFAHEDQEHNVNKRVIYGMGKRYIQTKASKVEVALIEKHGNALPPVLGLDPSLNSHAKQKLVHPLPCVTAVLTIHAHR